MGDVVMTDTAADAFARLPDHCLASINVWLHTAVKKIRDDAAHDAMMQGNK